MGKFLVASVAVIAVAGGVALYTTTKGPAAPVALASSQPVTAVISVEELDGKNKRIEELQKEVEDLKTLNHENLTQLKTLSLYKEKAQKTILDKNKEAIDLKDKIEGLERDLQSSRLACTLQRAENVKLIETFKELKKLLEAEANK